VALWEQLQMAEVLKVLPRALHNTAPPAAGWLASTIQQAPSLLNLLRLPHRQRALWTRCAERGVSKTDRVFGREQGNDRPITIATTMKIAKQSRGRQPMCCAASIRILRLFRRSCAVAVPRGRPLPKHRCQRAAFPPPFLLLLLLLLPLDHRLTSLSRY